MTRASFEMDNLMPDLTGDFDFGAFLNLPPDYVDQRVEDGLLPSPYVAWPFYESGSTFDFTPKLCNERHLDVPSPSHNQTLLDSSDSAGAHQSTKFQPQTNNAVPGFGYEASKPYQGEIGASECVRPSATALDTTGLEMMATWDCGEVCTIPSDQDSSPSLTDPASHEGSKNHCTCISCLLIHRGQFRYNFENCLCRFPGCLYKSVDRHNLFVHETGHYGQHGKRFTCLEQKCGVSTWGFAELKRHYKKHCTSPNKEQFPCPVSWCKYSGNNGFVRKDKLKSHYRNIHEGKPGPLKAGRVIKPATLKPRVSSVGNGPSKQKE